MGEGTTIEWFRCGSCEKTCLGGAVATLAVLHGRLARVSFRFH
jgi:hypothetical protein